MSWLFIIFQCHIYLFTGWVQYQCWVGWFVLIEQCTEWLDILQIPQPVISCVRLLSHKPIIGSMLPPNCKKYAAETKSNGKVHFSLKSPPISSLLATALLTDGIHSLLTIYGICQSHPRQYLPSVIMLYYQCAEMLVCSVSHSRWNLCNSAHSPEQYIIC